MSEGFTTGGGRGGCDNNDVYDAISFTLSFSTVQIFVVFGSFVLCSAVLSRACQFRGRRKGTDERLGKETIGSKRMPEA